MSTDFLKPPSHHTFTFGSITISSDFDSGNLSYVEKLGFSSYNLWIGADHPENNYRTWFYFSVLGFTKSHTVNFNFKNMHNQSRLFNQGLVPVYKSEKQDIWRRIPHPINFSTMCINNDGQLEFTFKFTFESDQKIFFAFFFPWSLQDNKKLLQNLEIQSKKISDIYFHRTILINSLENRPVELITISSKSKMNKKDQQIEDKLMFPAKNKPKMFSIDKKGIFISARVHPGEVPSSHVMNGVLKRLIKDDQIGRLLRQKFVFYIVPIINPDGVFRGHHRTDKNGLNLNRYYINPNPKNHSPIYGIKKFILHLHETKRFFSCLDLHAHAGRKGMFIYGNYSNELKKQAQICLFPKILSLNSQNFEYDACNFTQKNMYCKDKADSISKQGAARVALFKITKNPYCWTLQCNYNMNRIDNQITERNQNGDYEQFDINNIDSSLIINYKNVNQCQSKSSYKIQTYEKLGQQILDSYLDLIESHPYSRINNRKSIYKNLINLRLNLIVCLMRMLPYHFQSSYRRLLTIINSDKQQMIQKSIKLLYQIFIKNKQIQNIDTYLKSENTRQSSVNKLRNSIKQPNRMRIKNNQHMKKRKTIFQTDRLSNAQSKQYFKLSQADTNQTNSVYSNKNHQSLNNRNNQYKQSKLNCRLKQYFDRIPQEQILVASFKHITTLKVVNLKIMKSKPLQDFGLINFNKIPVKSFFVTKGGRLLDEDRMSKLQLNRQI